MRDGKATGRFRGNFDTFEHASSWSSAQCDGARTGRIRAGQATNSSPTRERSLGRSAQLFRSEVTRGRGRVILKREDLKALTVTERLTWLLASVVRAARTLVLDLAAYADTDQDYSRDPDEFARWNDVISN